MKANDKSGRIFKQGERKYAEGEQHKNIANRCFESCREYKLKYRIESVNRVLDFIRNEYRAGRICDLETLLCHCQNKLNGNIDGIELTLDKGKPFEILKVGESD